MCGGGGVLSEWQRKELSKSSPQKAIIKLDTGTSLVIQWLRLHTSAAGGPGSIPGRGTRSCMLCSAAQKKKKNILLKKTQLDTVLKNNDFCTLEINLRQITNWEAFIPELLDLGKNNGVCGFLAWGYSHLLKLCGAVALAGWGKPWGGWLDLGWNTEKPTGQGHKQ